MNRPQIFLIIIFALLISVGLVSCNTKERGIKKALKEHSLKEGTKYKLAEYRIVETILKSNLEDSIKNSEVSIEVEKEMMKLDSMMLLQYITEKEQCKIQQQNTSWYLSSSYDILIEDWQEMIDEQEEKLQEKQKKIDEINEGIKDWESLMLNSETPIIYYVIKHRYVLDGKNIEETVFLTTEYEIL